MLHFVRLTFLFLSLSAAGFVWAYRAHPEWVGVVDRWLCDRHMNDTQVIWDHVQESAKGGEVEAPMLHREVLEHLQALGEVRHGERRFHLWRELVVWYVGEARKWGELDRALAWQGQLMEATPRDVQQGLVQIELLMEKGRPKDLKAAREALTTIRLGLPSWEPAQRLDFSLAVAQQDWDLALLAVQDLQAAGGQELTQGWQFFFMTEGQAEIQASSRRNAVSDSSSHVVSLEFPSAATMKRLRVDPPAKAKGFLNRLRFVGVRMGGQNVELKLKKARDCEWHGSSSRLRLSGKPDPRVSLQAPAFPLRAIQVSFQPCAALPEDVLKATEEHEPLRTLLESRGLLVTDLEGAR